MRKTIKGIAHTGEIRRQIKTGEYAPAYLLTGDEGYLIHWIKKTLMDALAAPGDEMNVNTFTSDRVDTASLRDLAVTCPFFTDRRVILLDETGIFKTDKDGLLALLKELPATTVMVIAEGEVDKRTAAYKWIKKNGYVAEILKKDLTEKEVLDTVVGWLGREGKSIRRKDASYLCGLVGPDLYSLKQEADKLASFAGDRTEIRKEDIDSLVSPRIENKIFDMVDAIAAGNRTRVLACYNDMLILREEPMRILYMMARQYRILLIVQDMAERRASADEIAGAAGIPKYFVGKNVGLLAGYDKTRLKDSLEACLSTEEAIKTGRITDRMGVESLLIQLTGKLLSPILSGQLPTT